MEKDYQAKLSIYRSISQSFFLKWFEDNNLVSVFSKPETIPSLIFNKKWDENAQKIIDQIFEFLEFFGYLLEAGGTFQIGEHYNTLKDQLNMELVLNSYKNNEFYNFLLYGMRLFNDRLAGDTGFWSPNYLILFELGYHNTLFKEISNSIFENISKREKLLNIRPEKIALYGGYVYNYLDPIINQEKYLKKVTIITPNNIYSRLTETIFELKKETSQLSTKIINEEEINTAQYDVVILCNFGFFKTLKGYIDLLKKISRPSAYIYAHIPSKPEYSMGNESLYLLHPDFKKIPKESEITKYFKANAFSAIDRFGPNDSIFTSMKE